VVSVSFDWLAGKDTNMPGLATLSLARAALEAPCAATPVRDQCWLAEKTANGGAK